MEIEEVGSSEALPLLSLNHVSLLCRSVWESVRFYEDVLGFVLIKRPSSFKFNGAWLVPFLFSLYVVVLFETNITNESWIASMFSLNYILYRLYNYGIGIHLIENPDIDEFDACMNEPRPINPKDNHISFQVSFQFLAGSNSLGI